MVGKVTEAGNMKPNGADTAIAMIDMVAMRRTTRPGNFGGPDNGKSSNTRTRWTIFCSPCLEFDVFLRYSLKLSTGYRAMP